MWLYILHTVFVLMKAPFKYINSQSLYKAFYSIPWKYIIFFLIYVMVEVYYP
jgi:hypothetical protein